MRTSDVPQEDNRMHPGERKLAYAVDDAGRYQRVAYSGWKVEELVTSMAVEEFEQLARAAHERAAQGLSAALEYHMYARRMDVQCLAQCSGAFQFTVRRHLRVEVFARLGAGRLAKYAAALGMTVEALKQLPQQPEVGS
jgi:hypothetical protein